MHILLFAFEHLLRILLLSAQIGHQFHKLCDRVLDIARAEFLILLRFRVFRDIPQNVLALDVLLKIKLGKGDNLSKTVVGGAQLFSCHLVVSGQVAQDECDSDHHR